MAVVMEAPRKVGVRRLELAPLGPSDVAVEVEWSGVSTGTERLLWDGRMPSFPGMGYPLVPGYEAVGTVIDAGPEARGRIGERVFAPGSSAFVGARGLFGGAAKRLVTASARVLTLPEGLGSSAVLLALAATARHAIAGGAAAPDLIVGHGVLGRLLARIVVGQGLPPPIVWEVNPARSDGAQGYQVITPEADPRRDYRAICDASGAKGLLDQLIARLAKGGEVCLAGFYEEPLSFAFPPAFMAEARIRIAAEFTPEDTAAVLDLVVRGRLSLDGLVTHHRPADAAAEAYSCAFENDRCLKMALDWSGCA